MSRSMDKAISSDQSQVIRDALLASSATTRASQAAVPGQADADTAAAWASYHRAIDEEREKLEKTVMFANPQARAKLYHQLSELQAIAYNLVISPRLSFPRILNNTSFQTNMYTIGLLAPEMVYGVMLLDGAQTYRLTGEFLDARLSLIQGVNKLLGMGADSSVVGTYDLAEMPAAEAGRFELILGGPPRERNWIPLDAEAGFNFFLIRRLYLDPGFDRVGELRIERISAVDEDHYRDEEFGEAAIARRLRIAESFFRFWVNDFIIGLYDFGYVGAGNTANRMSLMPGLTFTAGSPLCRYSFGRFRIDPDEALLIEIPGEPRSLYWSFMLGDHWSRSLPFNMAQTSLSSVQAARDPDGVIRIVLAAKDPGVANWLDTIGHLEGAVMFRNYVSSDDIVPEITRIPLAELDGALPEGTARVSPDERKAAIARRREAYLRLYGE